MANMKIMLILLLTITGNIFAQHISVTCQNITINPAHKKVSVFLSKKGRLGNGGEMLAASLTDREHQNVKVQDFKAQMKEKTLMDSYVEHGSNIAGPFTNIKVYGIKLFLFASEPIATKIDGCIGRQVNFVNTYAICYEREIIAEDRF